ncbi:1-acyl-sn-glycerol-3-phosphate acyltransferase [Herbihabitans rhizosphaerae]|uniref:1-acyl-sn-glycerol-3-phosphate acyltransferase n=1 Tax=Herbihabitans rhizosphaerae TaxID=1872711 RepID=A0A4Q7L5K7_9PSEU|nr:lysophospholipid acyltransferase family protein [Herbihabitans rhizosphaerae]RZS43831.1 1-acyl-sn-glycerol-3-phosphate acyltransferase [Herbihabitans rhizosphaerae]
MSTALLPEGARPGLHRVARWLATWLYRPAYRIRVRGKENVPKTGPVVLVANHSSLIEPQLVFGATGRNSVFWVKNELYRGVLGTMLVAIGQLPLRRGEPDRVALLTAVRILKAGGMIGVFPEGGRGSGDVETAQQGAAWLVRSTGAVVLPVACRGTRRPEGSGRRFRPAVDVLIGRPHTVKVARGRAGLAEGTEDIRVLLADLVAELDEQRKRNGRG